LDISGESPTCSYIYLAAAELRHLTKNYPDFNGNTKTWSFCEGNTVEKCKQIRWIIK
jgi:hypothetical protein